MNTSAIGFSKILRLTLTAGLLGFILCYIPHANAAQRCGQGYHRNFFGFCVLNRPGPYATPAPNHPGCWRNANGYLRCYRR